MRAPRHFEGFEYVKNFLLQFFTWWHTNTLATRFFTWRKGEKVGEDPAGNIYYRSADDRRWVIYNGEIDASSIPSGWHGWIHHRTDVAPSEENYEAREWELPHVPNMTGTPLAYRPAGAIGGQTKREDKVGGYEAWTP